MAQPLFADSNRASMREIVELTTGWGETPAAGRTRARRFTQSSIVVTKDTVVSEEIRDDRMVSSVIETAASSGGELSWEFAAGSQDLDFQRVLQGTWTRPMEFDVFRGKIVAIKDSDEITISGGDYSAYFTVGRRIKLSGFLNTVNNKYAQISAVAHSAGVTTITVSSATLVAEAGSNFTSIADANDVILLAVNTIRFNNTANTIDSNGANAFSAAVAAKQLVAGQRIYVEGVGYETGTLTVASVVDGDAVTITDGEDTYIFEAQSDADIANASAFLFAIGVDDNATATNLAAKINAVRLEADFKIAAKVATNVVTLINLNKEGGDITDEAATITVSAFTGGDADFGGFYTLINVGNDALTVDRAVPTLAAGTPITIKGSMLRNPYLSAEITPQSATIETGFGDVSQFFVADGQRAGSLSMEVTAGSIITGSTSFMGRETKRRSTTKLAGAGYTVLDAAATENVSATANVGMLSVNGVQVATAIMSIKMSIEGNLRQQRAVGSKFPVGISAGRLNLTGTISAYFADGAMYDRFLNHETVSLAFPIIDPDKNTYYFTVPSFKIASDPISPTGTDTDVMEEMEFMAFRDNATRCMLQIDRFSSTEPVTNL